MVAARRRAASQSISASPKADSEGQEGQHRIMFRTDESMEKNAKMKGRDVFSEEGVGTAGSLHRRERDRLMPATNRAAFDPETVSRFSTSAAG